MLYVMAAIQRYRLCLLLSDDLSCYLKQSGKIWSLCICIWILAGAKLHAATQNSLQVNPGANTSLAQTQKNVDATAERTLERLSAPPLLIAAPENFNPSLRLPPPKPPKPPKPPEDLSAPPRTTETESITLPVLESIQTDFRNNTDNFGTRNLFIEPTVQFRLANDEFLTFKSGFNYFDEPGVASITNIPLQVGWQGKIGEVTLQTTLGVDVFDRLPTALSFAAKVDAPFAIKVSPSGQLLSGVVLSGTLEQGSYKFNAQTLDNQITAWRLGPSIYWQIDRDTSLFSTLRWGSYNDGNSEWQSFSRLERQLGQFRVAANLFTWNYASDLERTSGYFSPPDFLVYNAEVGWEGDIFDFLRCRIVANLGQQRLRGEIDNANGYQARCTAKISRDIEADLGYSFSTVRNQDTGGNTYGGSSLTGQVRFSF